MEKGYFLEHIYMTPEVKLISQTTLKSRSAYMTISLQQRANDSF